MPLIQSSAYVEICPKCTMHGRIVLKDGSKTRHFVTKRDGLILLASLQDLGAVGPEESKAIVEQIECSRMLREEDNLEEAFQKIVSADREEEFLEIVLHESEIPDLVLALDFARQILLQ